MSTKVLGLFTELWCATLSDLTAAPSTRLVGQWRNTEDGIGAPNEGTTRLTENSSDIVVIRQRFMISVVVEGSFLRELIFDPSLQGLTELTLQRERRNSLSNFRQSFFLLLRLD